MAPIDITPQARSIDIGDARLDYLEYDGQGETIVMLHATGFMPWLWHPIARSLANSYRVIAPYFCDHRNSEPETGGMNWGILARDFTEFCNRLGLKKPYLAGHSMGATVITIAAADLGLKPAAMVLFEPIYLPEELYNYPLRVEEHPLASKSIKRRNHWQDLQEAGTYLHSRQLFSRWDDEMLQLYLHHGFKSGDQGGLTLTCSPAREASLFMGSGHVDPWPTLKDIDCPVLVVEGAQSENRGFIDLKKAAGLMPHGTYHLVEDAGHLIPMERPSVAGDLIATFFRDAERNG